MQYLNTLTPENYITLYAVAVTILLTLALRYALRYRELTKRLLRSAEQQNDLLAASQDVNIDLREQLEKSAERAADTNAISKETRRHFVMAMQALDHMGFEATITDEGLYVVPPGDDSTGLLVKSEVH